MAKPKEGEEPKHYNPESETVVVFKDEIEPENGVFHIYIHVSGELGIEAFLGNWEMPGTGHGVEISYSGDSLYVYEYADEETAGGKMDTWKLDAEAKKLTVGDDRIEGGSMTYTLQDENHLVLNAGGGSYTLTRVKEED